MPWRANRTIILVIPSFITDYELIDLTEGTTVFIILFLYLQSLVICRNSAARKNVKFAIERPVTFLWKLSL